MLKLRLLPDFRKAEKVIIYAGAGMSADLGNAVYWSGDNGKYAEGLSEFGYTGLQHAKASLYEKDPIAQQKYHRKFWNQNTHLLIDTYYNSLLKKLGNKEYFIVTSNIDMAFRRAGFNPANIFEIHGTYEEWQCSKSNKHGTWKTDTHQSSWETCSVCGAIARPNAVFFDDRYFVESRYRDEQNKNYNAFKQNADPNKTLVLNLGIGHTVATLLNKIEEHMYENYTCWRINPEEVLDDESYQKVFHLTSKEFIKKL